MTVVSNKFLRSWFIVVAVTLSSLSVASSAFHLQSTPKQQSKLQQLKKQKQLLGKTSHTHTHTHTHHRTTTTSSSRTLPLFTSQFESDTNSNTSMEDNPDDASMTEVANGSSADLPPLKKAKVQTVATTTATAVVADETPNFLTGKEGVCRIEVARVEWATTAPWQRTPQSKASGTGFVIQGDLLLTNAHVVKSAVDIRVRKHGSTRRYPARVAVYAPDVDLALLELTGTQDERDEFFGRTTSNGDSSSGGSGSNNNNNGSNGNNDMALEFASKLPSLQESIHVVGFPTGGSTICITEGVVSRIDLVSASAFNNLLAIQIDAAINPGNSGGPAFDKEGKVTGVAFFKNTSKKTDNVGYLIPADTVRTFLGRSQLVDTTGESGGETTTTTSTTTTSLALPKTSTYTYTLSPSVPYDWHPLENSSLRLFHKVPPSVHGILLTSVSNTLHGILQPGDVLTHIDDKAIADDGQVVLRTAELIQHRYLLRGKKVDESTVFTVFRNGQSMQQCKPCVLDNIPSICLRWIDVDYPPDYLILGALVLLPLSWALRSHKRCGTRLIGETIDWCQKWPSEWEGKTGLVVLVDILSHEATFSYSRPWRRVQAYNGTPITSLEHLRDMWQASCETVTTATAKAESESAGANNSNSSAEPTFAKIELQSDDDIVLEVSAAMEAESDILKRHQIPKASNISPPNPGYK